MAEQNYAFVVDGMVTNIAVFDEPTEELLAHFKAELSLDHIIFAHDEPKAAIGGTWDGTKFTLPAPYASWVLNADNDWEPPVAMPVTEGKYYTWNEGTVSWDENDVPVATPE
jgi:hypothetical protein